MPECEVCGSGRAGKVAIIEGVRLIVCAECAKFGKEIEMEKREAGKGINEEELIDKLSEDYGKKIRTAREKLGLSPKEIGALLNEKESYIRRLEEEKTTPDEKILKKLEKVLKISLTEEVESAPYERQRKKELSIEEIAEIKKKGK